MATAKPARKTGSEVKDLTPGKANKTGKTVRGENPRPSDKPSAAGCAAGAYPGQQDRQEALARGRQRITEQRTSLFTRQLATMMKAGVPLLQAFDIVGRGHSKPTVGKLLLDIKSDVETGRRCRRPSASTRSTSTLFCNLVAAGEQAGYPGNLLDRLATYKEKIRRSKPRSSRRCSTRRRC